MTMKTDFCTSRNAKGTHRIAIHVWPATVQKAVPLLCVHGLTRNGRDFDRLAEALSATRTVYCPDMPGRGLSDNLPDPMDYGFAQYVTDAAAIIAHTGAAQLDWVGTSMGGVLGMLLAAQPNSSIRRLVLNDVGPLISQTTVERLGDRMKLTMPSFATLEEAEAHLRKIQAGMGVLSDADWRHFAETSTTRRSDGRLVYTYDPQIAVPFAQTPADVVLWDVYDKITCPTLVVRGAASELLPEATAQEMTRRGPCARLVEVEGAAHAPSLMPLGQIAFVKEFLDTSKD